MILSARDIAQQLANRVESYCHWLLPNGKRDGGNWCVGSVDGEAGSSLKIQLTGPKAGIFSDFATNVEKGDLLNLTAYCKRVPLGEAIKLAKDWLGIKDMQSEVPRKKYVTPKGKDVQKFTSKSPVQDYLKNVRKLNDQTIAKYRVSQSAGENGPEMAFPSFSFTGDLANIKYIAVKRREDGKKFVRQAGGCAPSIFGWQAVDPESREIIITEGELDAMTWFQFGFPAVSIPWGAGNDDWIDYDWDTLQQFDAIYLHFDADKEGKAAVEKAVRRLGLHRCMVITLKGFKDANEALTKGADLKTFQQGIVGARPISPQQIKSPSGFRDKVVEKFWPPGGVRPGFFSELLDHSLGLRPGETTVWTGISGHGKSVLLNQILLESIMAGYKVAVASMEMPGQDTLHRLICQAEMKDSVSVEEIDLILEWLAGRFWIYDLIGNVPSKVVLELMEYSFARHGVTMFLLDSLAKISIASDDYDAQRIFLNDVCSFARDTGVHVNIVAHARKGRDENEAPGKMDVKGASDIINQPDNLLSVRRNKSKEEAVRKGMEPARNSADTYVACSKQRENGIEFTIGLNFHRSTYRYTRIGQVTPTNLSILSRCPQPDLPMDIQPQ